MFQHLGSGEVAFFRYMADQNHRGERLLCEPGQQRGRFPHLGDAAGNAAGGLGMHDLNRVDDDHARSMLERQFGDSLDTRFHRDQQVVQRQRQSAGPVGNLLQDSSPLT